MTAIAIDGPAGAGKSTIARALARKLGYIYVDTGALYRSIGLYCTEAGVPLEDKAAVTAALEQIRVELRYVDGVQRVLLNGRDVSEEIRRPEISLAASSVSAMDTVRAFLFDLQRNMALEHDVVMDGRDIGTVVFPDAELKLFMTADTAVRACRRYKELTGKGMSVTMEEVERNIRERDKADMSRAVSPLRQADDAIVLDNSHMSVDEQMAWFMNEFQLKMKN